VQLDPQYNRGYIKNMNTIRDIEQAVQKLPPDELKRFRSWFDRFDAQVWDEQFQNDVKAGRLDKIADCAINDFMTGRCREL
jgi:hypothetical protein